ncbi:putative anaerobic ribonucleoside-triphosphate reductase [Clostridium phage phiCTP1]|uniref:putative anaerobic ribonucleoside-triphosphate reductase n=1 Tax=Clostridium phage phiCTP1 TaxID=871584 RepID=UPI0001E0783F|nr:putative anaerobic ribonucleoside-triphosphate reductase [Clostridium phage phiCTP1]ADL40347.1 putative anaerobic ribonucleoside-triphosphate reductase [Clostridium phage phiCTP1]
MLDVVKTIDDYLSKRTWKVKNNSNAPYSFGALNKYLQEAGSKEYWLNKVYTPEIKKFHEDGFGHIHDLGGLTIYCCGYSLQKILLMGVKGVPNIPTSAPAKHFDAILNQLANLVTVFQNEIMGAVAFSAFDTLLAPFIREDNLDYRQVKQSIQNYIYSVNSNSRNGAEPAFSNLSFDIFVPRDLKEQPAIIGGVPTGHTYGEYQKEMNMLNKAFYEVMLHGDALGKPFAYPIPTFSIMNGFDWDNPNNADLWKMTGKYGYPYFSNFMNSDMDPSDVRSMCCRMNLDLRQLRKRNGGLFGSGDSTGSIGNVTLNLPRFGLLSHGDKGELKRIIKKYMIIAKDSLELKRAWLSENVLGTGLIPAFDTYVGTLDNHFSTIGHVGLNEMCLNFNGKDILDADNKKLCEELLDYMSELLIEFQEETGHLYNLEASPAESTCHSLALKDVEKYGSKIKTQGEGNSVYYTNSCHIPVSKVSSLQQLFEHQDGLQVKYTGGTVVHIYTGGAISGEQAKSIIKTVCENYRVPYVSISPLVCYCPKHGVLDETVEYCPKCGTKTTYFQRITGYIRIVDNFNAGKMAEFYDRHQLLK